ncbi:NADP-dependent oxidoreductase [Kitasatospora camelliae]|uniref:NADP-dependent oxidoreductase n=1 Tax=Kitasatospora camelliae TaxID=3156397 RepID=A0AAU8JW66_9ACTN
MRALVISTFGGPEVLELAELELPVPGPGEVRVRNQALAVHPADIAVRSGAVAAHLPEAPFHRLGWDVAGTVDAVGEGVTGFRPGDRVIGLSHWFATRNGTHAEFAVVAADALAPVPEELPIEKAAALPLNGLTARQSLDLAGLSEGQTLVVTGAAGNLGGYTTELAVRRGLRVIAVAGAGDRAFLTGLGAEFVERGPEAVAAIRALAPEGADAAVDTALLGAELIAAVKAGGVFVTVRPNVGPAPERDVRVSVINVRPDGGELAELARLAADGLLTVRVDSVHDLADAAAAHARLSTPGTRGAVLLTV